MRVRCRAGITVALSLAAVLTCAFPARAAAPPWVPSEGVGNVHMPISCSPAVQAEFDRALALLHSFWYDRALLVFADVAANDPNCQIAYWGAAMTFDHPLWAPPSAKDVRSALSYIERGRAASTRADREAQLFAAVQTLYGDGDPAAKSKRDAAYAQQMGQIYQQYPDDEVALFYALALEGSPGYRSDPAAIEHAGSLAETVHTHQPTHPGAMHYIIHAYDEHGYEARALSAARLYAGSAQAIPHALHMPSHTFLALGLWDESNATNTRAWDASTSSVKAANGPPYDRDFHTLNYLIYGELQVGNFAGAKRLTQIALAQYKDALRLYPTMSKADADDAFDMAEMSRAIATYSFETGDYSMAGSVTDTGLYGPSLFTQITLKALAALSRHDLVHAKMYRDRLKERAAAVDPKRRTLADIAMIAADEVAGLYAVAAGDREGALASFQQAASIEALTPLGVSQPAFLPPANELLGWQLLSRGQHAKAREAFAVALQLTPNRRNAILGMAKASVLP